MKFYIKYDSEFCGTDVHEVFEFSCLEAAEQYADMELENYKVELLEDEEAETAYCIVEPYDPLEHEDLL